MRALLLSAFLLAPLAAQAMPHAPIAVIRGDYGGNVLTYLRRSIAWTEAGAAPRVTGPCASACTLALQVPNVCVTGYAALGFHQASNEWGTGTLWAAYPSKVRDWLTIVNAKDLDRMLPNIPLTPHLRWLTGPELWRRMPVCDNKE